MSKSIGNEVIYKGKVYHVQDTDTINQMLKIGIPDVNRMVFESFWVSCDNVQDLEAQEEAIMKSN